MSTTFWSVIGDAADAVFGTDFDPKLVGASWVEIGALADRARGVAARLNRVRVRPPKQPVLLQTSGYLAVTRRGPWVYVASDFARRLSDDALAFVLAHEMAHHDLDHLSLMYAAAGMLGFQQKVELAADREGLAILTRAGFDPRGAIEAFDKTGDEPPDPLAGWPPALKAHVDRFRRSHPPLEVRRAEILRVSRAGASRSD